MVLGFVAAGAASLLLAGSTAAQNTPPVIAAAGDIACDPSSAWWNNGDGDARNCQQRRTSDLLLNTGLTAVLPLGDIQYQDNAPWKYAQSYDPTWGRLKPITRPAIGNHEYYGGGSTNYFDYFNGVGIFTGPAGDRDKGYYSFDVGNWHLIALNSVCTEIGGCGPGSPQERWLRADLAANPAACVLAYWHHPLFTSGGTTGWTSARPLWQALHDAGADLILNGHAHHYERFAPQEPSGAADPAYGLRQFIVGTGGKSLGGTATPLPNSEVRDRDTFGSLRLTLRDDGYDWTFDGGDAPFRDSGSAACHGAPPVQPATARTGPPTAVSGATATLNAAIDPNAQETNYRFEYGPNTGYGSTTPLQSAGHVNSSARQVSATLTGLTAGRTYHYRVVSTNASGTVEGGDRTFTAAAPADGPYARVVRETPGLLSYWRLGEATGDVAFDDRGGQLGLLSGGARLGQPGGLVDDGDLAAGFDGTSGEMTAEGPIVSNSATLEGWFHWEGGGPLMRDDSWAGGWMLAYNSGGSLAYRVAGKIFRTGRTAAAVSDGRWHHLALTKDGPNAALYVDGEPIHTATGVPDVPATAPWHVMRGGVHINYARGRADEVAIYDRALAASDVNRHYMVGRASRVAPDTAIGAGPRALTRNRSPHFSFTSNKSDVTFVCELDRAGSTDVPGTPCTSPTAFSHLRDGSYTFSVRALDPDAADPTPATRAFAIDATPPAVSVRARSRRLAAVLKSGLVAVARSSEAGKLRLDVVLPAATARRLRLTRTRAPLVIGTSGNQPLAAPGATTLTVRVGRRTRRALRRLRAVKVTLRLTATDAARNRRVDLRTPTFRR